MKRGMSLQCSRNAENEIQEINFSICNQGNNIKGKKFSRCFHHGVTSNFIIVLNTMLSEYIQSIY